MTSLQGTGDLPRFVAEPCVGDLLGNGGLCQLHPVERNAGGNGRQWDPREASFGGVDKHLPFYDFEKSRCSYRIF